MILGIAVQKDIKGIDSFLILSDGNRALNLETSGGMSASGTPNESAKAWESFRRVTRKQRRNRPAAPLFEPQGISGVGQGGLDRLEADGG